MAKQILAPEQELDLMEELEHKLAAQTTATLRQLLEATDYDEKDWVVIYDEAKGGRQELLDKTTIAEMRNKARWMYWQGNEYIRRAVRNAVNYVVGVGMTFTLADAEQYPEGVKESVEQCWKLFSRINHWPSKQRETVERGQLDGEWFYHFKPRGNTLLLRFLEPEDIDDPTPGSKWTLGIQYEEDDVESVLGYAWNPGKSIGGSPSNGWLAPDIVQHGFWFGTRSMVRGIPPFIPILHRVKQYDGWITDRLVLNKLRARIALIRKHLGAAPSQVTAFADATKDGDTTRSGKTGDTTDRRRMFKPGTIIDSHGRTEYEFLTPNVQAADVQHDGRAVLLSITAGTGQTEVMITADASNSNFASTWIAEAPAVKEFALGQGICIEEWEGVWHKVMLHGQQMGVIPVNPMADVENLYSGYDVEIQPPRLVSRDRDKDTRANSEMFTQGVISRKTWQLRDELNPREEDVQLEAEREQALELGHQNEAIPQGYSTTTTMEGETE